MGARVVTCYRTRSKAAAIRQARSVRAPARSSLGADTAESTAIASGPRAAPLETRTGRFFPGEDEAR